MKKIVITLVLLLTVFQVYSQDEYVRGNGWEAARFMKSEGVLIVYYYENKPFIYTNEDGQLQGIEYDLLSQFRNYLFHKHNVKIKLVWKKAESTEDFHQAVAKGDRGSIGIGAVTITEDKQHNFKYSSAYMSDISVIITNEEVKSCDNIETFREQFGKFKAVSIQNSGYEYYYEKLKKIMLPKLEIQHVRNNDQIVQTIATTQNTFGYIQLPSYLLALKNGEKIKRHKWFMESNDNGYGFILPVKTTWDEPLKEFFNNIYFKDSVNAITVKYLGADIAEFVTELQDNGNTETRSGDGNEIAVLDKENAIKQLRIKEQELQAISDRTSRNTLIFGVMLILMVATIFYFRFRNKQKANVLLEKVNAQLQSKNEEVFLQAEEITAQHEEISRQKLKLEKLYEHTTDSIRYARRIQEAILPDKKLITDALPESFIFFNPKDELSGDFYWFTQTNNLKIIVSIDCTGHGVPGAFMTVMGSALLEEIINTNENTSPEIILELLDKKITTSLMQGHDSTHDGMDISIVAIDNALQTLTFAAAKQTLYQVKTTELEKQLIEIKGSIFEIGGQLGRFQKQYTNTVINYQENDSFYMTTDGYQSQFNTKHEKFMRKRLKETIMQFNHLSMLEQRSKFKFIFADWKGDTKQTDDILVVGFRI